MSSFYGTIYAIISLVRKKNHTQAAINNIYTGRKENANKPTTATRAMDHGDQHGTPTMTKTYKVVLFLKKSCHETEKKREDISERNKRNECILIQFLIIITERMRPYL